VSRRGTGIAAAAAWAMIAAGLAMAGGASAADMERGRALYENHCQSCHTKKVHGRPDRWPGTVADLRQAVTQWKRNENLPWTAEEIEDVVAYLNDTQYRFSR